MMRGTSWIRLVGFVGALAPLSAAAGASNPASEAARVQQFLDGRYRPSDVRRSFHTKFGETIDCVDFFAQAGVKKMAALGHPITSLPPPVPPPTQDLPPELAEVSFLGQPDDQGNPRSCPPDAVPILRLTAADISAAGGLDSFLKAATKKAVPGAAAPSGPAAPSAPPFGGACGPGQDGNSGYAHVEQPYTYNGGFLPFSAAHAWLSIWDPPLYNTAQQDHSLGQVWVTDGGTCTGIKQTVEVGWNVDPTLYAGNNPTGAHLFIYSTTNGYQNPEAPGTGCYNNIAAPPNTDYCVPWTGFPSATLTPGMTLNASWYNGQQWALVITVTTGSYANVLGWQIGVPGLLGQYPLSDFTGAFATAGQSFVVGGEVYDHTGNWVVPMGSMSAPAAGASSAAMWKDLQVWDGTEWQTTFDQPFSTRPQSYSYVGSGVTAGYYGDVPNVWWPGSYGTQWSPVGTWASGSIGECPLGNAVLGLSASPDASHSHAIMCGQRNYSPPSNGSGCNVRQIYSSDNRGYSGDGDWDQGYIKDECGVNEYVQAVSQSATGALSGVLCCPGSPPPRHLACSTLQVASQRTANWDPGNNWVNCNDPGQYVAGVSRDFGGGVHRILCCIP